MKFENYERGTRSNRTRRTGSVQIFCGTFSCAATTSDPRRGLEDRDMGISAVPESRPAEICRGHGLHRYSARFCRRLMILGPLRSDVHPHSGWNQQSLSLIGGLVAAIEQCCRSEETSAQQGRATQHMRKLTCWLGALPVLPPS